MPSSPHTYDQPSQSTPKEDKTITFSAKNISTTTFWSPILKIDALEEDISQWVYHEELQPDPPLKG